MRRGEQLNWIKNIVSTMNMAIPAHKIFLLTHAPIVGHGGKGTHYNRRNPDKDMDELFVKWVNGGLFESQKDPHVEAVFCGHTHLSGGYKDINELNMDMKNFNLDTENIPFTWSTVYIETTTACKNYP